MATYLTGNTIRTLREKKGCTQRELAATLGVTDKAVSKWETGKGLPDIALIEPLAKALGVSVAELLSGAWRRQRQPFGQHAQNGVLRVPRLRQRRSTPPAKARFPAAGSRCRSKSPKTPTRRTRCIS